MAIFLLTLVLLLLSSSDSNSLSFPRSIEVLSEVEQPSLETLFEAISISVPEGTAVSPESFTN
jgi:hypothetical protein